MAKIVFEDGTVVTTFWWHRWAAVAYCVCLGIKQLHVAPRHGLHWFKPAGQIFWRGFSSIHLRDNPVWVGYYAHQWWRGWDYLGSAGLRFRIAEIE